MSKIMKIIICVDDEKLNCHILEQKLSDYFETIKTLNNEDVKISLHIPECNLHTFMNEEKEFAKSMFSKKLLVKFNHRLISIDKEKKEAILEKTDRAGNKDQFIEYFDDIILIHTNQQ